MKRIIFKQLEISNFMAYGEDVTIDLENRGLVLVLGENKDSVAMDSNGAGKTTIPEALYWCLYGKTLKPIPAADVINNAGAKSCFVALHLEVDGKDFTVRRDRTADGVELSIGADGYLATGKAAKRFLLEEFAIDETVFGNFVCFGSERIKMFHEMTDAEKKEMFESLYPVLGSITEAHDKVKDKVKLLEERREEAVRAYESARSEIVRIQSELKKAKRESDKDFRAFESEMKSVRSKLSESRVALEKARLNPDLTKEVDTHKFDKQVRSLRERRGQCHVERVSASTRASTIKNQMRSMKRNAVCPTCKRPWKTYDKSVMTKLQEKMKSELEKVVACDKELRELFKRISEVEDQINTRQAYAEEKRSDAKEYYNRVHETVRGLEIQLKSMEKVRPKDYDRLVRLLEKRLKEHRMMRDQAKESKARWDKQLAFYGNVMSVTDDRGFKSYLLDEVLQHVNAKANMAASKLVDGELTVQLVPDSTGEHYGRQGKIKLLASNSKGSDLYEGMSSGEKLRIDLCVMFGLVLAVSDLCGFNVAFLSLDEVFDKSLDTAGVERVVKFIEQDILPYKQTVFVTSHNETLKEFFSNKILVVKENHKSKIVEV